MKNCDTTTCTTCACHFKAIPLGLAMGVLWGLSILIMGLVAHFTGFGAVFVKNVGNLYMEWYEPATIMGSILGGFIGFVDAFIKGVLIAWLYNMFSRCCAHCNKTAVDIT